MKALGNKFARLLIALALALALAGCGGNGEGEPAGGEEDPGEVAGAPFEEEPEGAVVGAPVTLPDVPVEGISYDTWRSRLIDRCGGELCVRINQRFEPTEQEGVQRFFDGQVISTDPSAGERVRRGSTVTVVVAKESPSPGEENGEETPSDGADTTTVE